MTNDIDRDPGRIYLILGELYLQPPTESIIADVATWADRGSKRGPMPSQWASVTPRDIE